MRLTRRTFIMASGAAGWLATGCATGPASGPVTSAFVPRKAKASATAQGDCLSQARIFGDQEDAASPIAMLLKKEKSFRLQEDKGTKPNVHYIGKYSVRA